jgi:LmbE family N-acetylglucosaminyl deacetylase
MAAVDAVYPAARNPMAFPWLAKGGLAAHVVRRLYLFWPNDPNVWVDVSATVDRKIDALRAHASQIHEPAKLETRIRDWAAETGTKIGAAGAEAFRLVVIEADEDEGPTGGSTTETANAAEATPAPEAAAAGSD